MSVHLAARRLALSTTHPPSLARRPAAAPSILSRRLAPAAQRRHKWSLKGFKSPFGGAGKTKSADPLTAELDDPQKREQFLQRNIRGSAQDSIFQDEIDAAAPPSDAPRGPLAMTTKTRETMAMVTDPDPRSRVCWLRKKVIQMVRCKGRLSKEDRLKMSERELRHKSDFLPTSLKKLVMLSRQIAGKTVDDAITQMQWSKKKVAAEVKYYLEEARDLAIAQRGMGLSKVNGDKLDTPRKIKTKDGKWVEIADPTRIYVAQSWVGRGPWRGKSINFHGRGHTSIKKHPSTSFTVVLKEEKTRLREHDEAEAKKAAKGPWIHLPDRPIHGQRPYYTW